MSHVTLLLVAIGIIITLMSVYLVVTCKEQRKEAFTTYDRMFSTSELWQSFNKGGPAELDKNMNIMAGITSDSEDLLHMSRCYQFANKRLENIQKEYKDFTFLNNAHANGMYSEELKLITCDFAEVKQLIKCRIQNFYETQVCNRRKKLDLCSLPTNTQLVNSFASETTPKCPFNKEHPMPNLQPFVRQPQETNSAFALRIWGTISGEWTPNTGGHNHVKTIVIGKDVMDTLDLLNTCELALSVPYLEAKAKGFGCAAVLQSGDTYSKGTQESTTKCSKKLKGPIYALIFQAPYYRSQINEPITAQFQVGEYDYFPYNLKKVPNDASAAVYYYIVLMYSKYTKNGTFLADTDHVNQTLIPDWDKKYYSSERHCEIRTIQDRSLFAGCASTEMDDQFKTRCANKAKCARGTPYEATCLGPKDPVNPSAKDERVTVSSYGTLYRINSGLPEFEPFMDQSLLNVSNGNVVYGNFDARRYINHYPDLRRLNWSDDSGRKHYAEYGIREKRLGFIVGEADPGKWSDTGYLTLHNDVKMAKMTAQAHYKAAGWKERRKIALVR